MWLSIICKHIVRFPMTSGFSHVIEKSNDIATNSCTNLFCTNWYGMIRLVEWKYKLIKTNHVGQMIFNSTNIIMPHQFVQNKFVQEFVAIHQFVSLLFLIWQILYNCWLGNLFLITGDRFFKACVHWAS